MLSSARNATVAGAAFWLRFALLLPQFCPGLAPDTTVAWAQVNVYFGYTIRQLGASLQATQAQFTTDPRATAELSYVDFYEYGRHTVFFIIMNTQKKGHLLILLSRFC